MKALSKNPRTVLILLFLFAFQGRLPSQISERYFDRAKTSSDRIRLVVLYPVDFAVRILDELRQRDFLAVENLLVIGVYHEQEVSDYKAAFEYVKQKNIDWFTFHKVEGSLGVRNLFQKNDCTADFLEIFKKSDGIIFFGGADIPPAIYQDKTNLLTLIETPYRHYIELSFIFHLLGGFQDDGFKPLLESNPLYAVLGICLGCQSLNVGTGGSLSQDIWSEIYGKKYVEDVIGLEQSQWHRNPYTRLHPDKKFSGFLMHPIRLEKDGKFSTEMGFNPDAEPYVSSAHHQALKNLGKGMEVIATSLDGKIIEAVAHKKYPNVLGVQFHPEMPWLWDDTIRFKFTPDDSEEMSFRSILDKNPPSFPFHEKLWLWFREKLKESFNSK